MPTLKDVAEKSRVSLLTAYHALSNADTVDDQTRRLVLEAAEALGYRLNVTIRDVASLAEVSIATVSYVLNNSYPVRTETRERVLTAVNQLGYRPNTTARSLQSSQSRLIGYAWHIVEQRQVNAILDRFLYWMAQAAEARGYHVLTFAQPQGNPIPAYEDLIQTNRVDGFIIANTNQNDARIRHLMNLRIPFAAFGRANEEWDFPYVDVDGRHGIQQAVTHLLSLGHTQIAVLGWPEGSLSGDARLEGYFDAMRAAGLEPCAEWVVRTQGTSAAARQATEKLMSLPAPIQPTAVVCLSDIMAVGAMHALDNLGLRIGPDVALTGFDDDPLSELLRPPLTSLRQPIDQIAAQVVDLLIAELEGVPLAQRQVLLAPSLIVRASSDPTMSQHVKE